MSEIEPIRPTALLRELGQHQTQIEYHQDRLAYHIERARRLEGILDIANTIYVPDEVWANGRNDKS